MKNCLATEIIMASILKRFAANTSQSERRPVGKEHIDNASTHMDQVGNSPTYAPRLNLAKFVAINNAMSIQKCSPLCRRERLNCTHDEGDVKFSNIHIRSKSGVVIKARLPGTSGDNLIEATTMETPSRPVFEDKNRPLVSAASNFFQSVFMRRNSCSASIRVPSSPNTSYRRISLTDAQMSESPQLTKLLGTGGFGCVYMGELDNRRVAVKRFHGRTKNEKAKAESFRAESIAKTLRHPNIVRVFGTASKENTNCVIMEYVGDTNLQQIINNQDEPLDILRRISFLQDIASALKFIHAQNFVHLDVKPANILITPYDTCKLGDFGCCQMIEGGTGRVSPTQRSYLTGTFAYRAPELLRGEAPSTSADIYSLGITQWQLTHRRQPYAGQNQHVVVFGVVAYGLRPDSAAPSSSEPDVREIILRDMYMRCWQANHSERPTAHCLIVELSECKNNWLRVS